MTRTARRSSALLLAGVLVGATALHVAQTIARDRPGGVTSPTQQQQQYEQFKSQFPSR